MKTSGLLDYWIIGLLDYWSACLAGGPHIHRCIHPIVHPSIHPPIHQSIRG